MSAPSPTRSLRPDVRNPMLAIPAMQAIIAFCERDQPIPPRMLRALLKALAADCRDRADKAWDKHKAPMASYWKVVATYAGHTQRAMRPAQPPRLFD